MLNFFTKLFDSNAKQLAKFDSIVAQVNTLEESIKKLKDKELPGKTAEFKKRIQSGESLDDILPEALATIRESIRRVTGERAYDVQLLSALSLYHGRISEQKTGEGKTLSATLASYVRVSRGSGCACCDSQRLSGQA
jgi:preprotein translocase subunit SecA